MKLSSYLLLSVSLLHHHAACFVNHTPPSPHPRARPRQYQQARSSLRASPDPIVSEGDWSAYLDETNTGCVYYFNTKTGESLWEPPTDTFPIVQLDDERKKLAETKRKAYIEATKEAAVSTIGSRVTQKVAGGEAVTATKQSTEELNWFEKAFQQQPKEQEPISSASEVAEKTEEKGFFQSMLEIVSDSSSAVDSQTLVTPEEPVKVDVKKVEMAAFVMPHPAKILWGGEDAVFTRGRTFGVFDGVSGARKLDGIPLYSKTLATEMKRRSTDTGMSIKELTQALEEAAAVADKKATGASTAIVASIGEDGFLRALNLGDSSCIVVRNGKIVSKTKEISHYFECPYQLSTDSPDRPKDGTKLNLELVPGDLIVAGSDGIFDNLSDSDILDVIAGAPSRLPSIAKQLTQRSRKVSLDKKAETPYAKAAKKNGDPDFAEGVGGKVDDVSCIVARYA